MVGSSWLLFGIFGCYLFININLIVFVDVCVDLVFWCYVLYFSDCFFDLVFEDFCYFFWGGVCVVERFFDNIINNVEFVYVVGGEF